MDEIQGGIAGHRICETHKPGAGRKRIEALDEYAGHGFDEIHWLVAGQDMSEIHDGCASHPEGETHKNPASHSLGGAQKASASREKYGVRRYIAGHSRNEAHRVIACQSLIEALGEITGHDDPGIHIHCAGETHNRFAGHNFDEAQSLLGGGVLV